MNKKPLILIGAGIAVIIILALILIAIPKLNPAIPANIPEQPSSTATSTADSSVAASTTKMLQVVSPNGGETLVSGQKYTIAWKEIGVKKIYLSLVNGGKEFGMIATIEASDKKYEWTVPDMSGWVSSGLDPTKFKIFISENSALGVRDESDATFAIADASSSRSAGAKASTSAAVKVSL